MPYKSRAFFVIIEDAEVNEMLNNIKEKLATLPCCPGVYLMKNAEGEIIYVGKSKILKNRVSQYFQNSASHSPKTRAMVSQIADFEYIITDTENEALALECNLIKKHKPKYNILLKDDKQYPYLKITTHEDFPRMFLTRKLVKDGSTYLGPFMTVLNIKEAVEELRKNFRIRNCNKFISENSRESRPCLYYQIGQCSAPCCGKINKEDYKKLIDQVVAVLNGKYKKITGSLTERMEEAAKNLDFEKAAILRDRINNIKTFGERQKVSSSSNGNMDFIGVYKENTKFCVQVFYYRDGNAVKSEYFTFEDEEILESEVLESFVKQFYFTQSFIPRSVYISHEIEDVSGIESWLSQICGHKVSFQVPQKGVKADTMKMVLKNAQESLYKEQLLKNRNESYQNRMLSQLKDLLGLNKTPIRIESYDISNFSGSSSIGVQIVYENAAPNKKLYRKFNVKTVQGADDYQSMQEVISRRINEAYKEEDMFKNGELESDKIRFLPLPDLILLDGGKGHVSAVKAVLDMFGEDIPLFGLVKDDSHKTRGITDGNSEIILDKHSEIYKFLACMQDEVHRYAITACRKRHEKSNIKSQLEEIPGVGPNTRKKLLTQFGGLKGVKKASLDELTKVVTTKTAENILKYFEENK